MFSPENFFLPKKTFSHKNHATSSQRKSSNLLTQNIARIAKRCPENISSIVKCVKLLFPKVLKKYLFTVAIAVTVVRQIMQPLHKKITQPYSFLFLFSKLLEKAI